MNKEQEIEYLKSQIKTKDAALRAIRAKLQVRLPNEGGWENQCPFCGKIVECGALEHTDDCVVVLASALSTNAPGGVTAETREASGVCYEDSERTIAGLNEELRKLHEQRDLKENTIRLMTEKAESQLDPTQPWREVVEALVKRKNKFSHESTCRWCLAAEDCSCGLDAYLARAEALLRKGEVRG